MEVAAAPAVLSVDVGLSAFGRGQSQIPVQSSCPFGSPWDIGMSSASQTVDDMNGSMYLDDFIPLDELLEVSLHSMDSACSDRTDFQVRYRSHIHRCCREAIMVIVILE